MHIGIHTGWGDETEREKGNMGGREGGSDGGEGRGGGRGGQTDSSCAKVKVRMYFSLESGPSPIVAKSSQLQLPILMPASSLNSDMDRLCEL